MWQLTRLAAKLKVDYSPDIPWKYIYTGIYLLKPAAFREFSGSLAL